MDAVLSKHHIVVKGQIVYRKHMFQRKKLVVESIMVLQNGRKCNDKAETTAKKCRIRESRGVHCLFCVHICSVYIPVLVTSKTRCCPVGKLLAAACQQPSRRSSMPASSSRWVWPRDPCIPGIWATPTSKPWCGPPHAQARPFSFHPKMPHPA